MRPVIIFFLFVCICLSETNAKPQFSNFTGNRCISCHIDAQGGSTRSLLGAYTRSTVSLVDLKSIGLHSFFKDLNEYHSFWDERIIWGFDYRLQSAKLGGPVNNKREIFGMQASPYLAFTPVDWLTLQGEYNFVKALYPAQKSMSFSVLLKPSYDLPYLKAGFFRPSIGLSHDDHTVLIRQVASATRANPVIPPDYAEIGAEITYNSLKFFSITAGIHSTESMSENLIIDKTGKQIPLVESDKIASNLKAVFMPRFFGNMLNVQLGGSYYFADDLNIIDAFLMLGWTDELSFLAEVMMTNKEDLRTTSNALFEIMYNYMPSLRPYIRYEIANTKDMSGPTDLSYDADQYVIGLNLYLVPYVEIRPEYRIYDRASAEGYSSQWTLQLHLYY